MTIERARMKASGWPAAVEIRLAQKVNRRSIGLMTGAKAPAAAILFPIHNDPPERGQSSDALLDDRAAFRLEPGDEIKAARLERLRVGAADDEVGAAAALSEEGIGPDLAAGMGLLG